MTENELLMAFEGPGGQALLAWCVQAGHLDKELGENAVDVVEHNLVMRLLKETGIKILPIIPRTIIKKKEHKIVNLIDSTLKELEGE